MENKEFNYYKSELSKLTDLTTVSLQLYDYSGNKTKIISLNDESIKELEQFFNEFKKQKKGELK